MGTIKKSVKALAVCIALFAAMTAACSLMMQTGVLPDEAAKLCMYVILSLCCFAAGAAAAVILPFRGILSGISAAAVFVVFIWCGISLYTGEINPAGMINKINLIPLAAGMLGGITGSNTKK